MDNVKTSGNITVKSLVISVTYSKPQQCTGAQ